MNQEKTENQVESENALADETVDETPEMVEDFHGELLKKLDEAQSEARENRDRYLRAVAEQENFRKRVVRDKEQLRKYGAALLLEDMLPILDSLAMGLELAGKHPEAKPVADGFSMIFSQLQSLIKQHGVIELNPQGEKFDPHFHEALAHQPCEEVEEGKIMAVTRMGYRLHDRLLRPASVVVSSGGSKPETEESSN